MNIQNNNWQIIWKIIWKIQNTKLNEIKIDIFGISVFDKIIVICQRIGKIETILYN